MEAKPEEFEKIRYAVEGHVATITLDDPDTRNSLSDLLLDELLCALSMAKSDDEVRVVVLASSDEKVFSAGGNLSAFGGEAGTIDKFIELMLSAATSGLSSARYSILFSIGTPIAPVE